MPSSFDRESQIDRRLSESHDGGDLVGPVANRESVPTESPEAPSKAAPETDVVNELPAWRVLLHNDDFNYMEDVVETILELTPLTMNEAIERMLEAHLQGISLLVTTHRERAELYLEQFESKALKVTIEPGD
ncbi:MAG: ATP-dependent Clp protease adaptor ClpS [Phycisphaerales bacterium]